MPTYNVEHQLGEANESSKKRFAEGANDFMLRFVPLCPEHVDCLCLRLCGLTAPRLTPEPLLIPTPFSIPLILIHCPFAGKMWRGAHMSGAEGLPGQVAGQI